MIALAQASFAAGDASLASAALFYLLAGVSAVSAIGVVASRNIVRTAVCLLFTLLGVAGLYFLLDAEFLAAVQMVIYAGGTLILIVFGVMLTSRAPATRFEARPWEKAIAAVLGIVLLAALATAIVAAPLPTAPLVSASYPMAQLGVALMGPYFVPFEVSSVLLLTVMIGAAFLARGRRRSGD
jgi:NADH-quinone oxidoreductase subunit J